MNYTEEQVKAAEQGETKRCKNCINYANFCFGKSDGPCEGWAPCATAQPAAPEQGEAKSGGSCETKPCGDECCEDCPHYPPAQPATSEVAAGDEDAGEANVAHSLARSLSCHAENYANVGDAEWDASVLAHEVERLRAQLAERDAEIARLREA